MSARIAKVIVLHEIASLPPHIQGYTWRLAMTREEEVYNKMWIVVQACNRTGCDLYACTYRGIYCNFNDMSIVIAKKMDGVTIILSDTKVSIDSTDISITGGSKLRVSPVEGALKSIILFGGICISYAGDVQGACDIINEFEKKRFKKLEEMTQYLQAAIISNKLNVEFILSCANKDAQYLFKITKDEVSPSSSSVWIGSHRAFSSFQHIYDLQKKEKEEQTAFRDAFRMLLEEQRIPEIGDFMIEAVFNPSNGCCYFYSDSLFADRGPSVIKLKANETTTIDDGDAAIGSYTISALVSNLCSKPALLHFFNQGNFGILYIPRNAILSEGKGIVIQNITPETVFSEIKRLYDINLMGPYFSDGKICYKGA